MWIARDGLQCLNGGHLDIAYFGMSRQGIDQGRDSADTGNNRRAVGATNSSSRTTPASANAINRVTGFLLDRRIAQVRLHGADQTRDGPTGHERNFLTTIGGRHQGQGVAGLFLHNDFVGMRLEGIHHGRNARQGNLHNLGLGAGIDLVIVRFLVIVVIKVRIIEEWKKDDLDGFRFENRFRTFK